MELRAGGVADVGLDAEVDGDILVRIERYLEGATQLIGRRVSAWYNSHYVIGYE